MTTSTDKIERRIHIQAPRTRVWHALSNAEAFGNWFGVALQGKTFTPGQHTRGQVTQPGYEYITFDVQIEKMEPERLMSWRWRPAPVEKHLDYTSGPTTLVVFELHDADGGTLLTVVESGFDNVPPERRMSAYRLNSHGWEEQLKNIARHVANA